jgi:hypothetical protein
MSSNIFLKENNRLQNPVFFVIIKQLRNVFNTLEIIFCAFLAENYFVKVFIQLVWAKELTHESHGFNAEESLHRYG